MIKALTTSLILCIISAFAFAQLPKGQIIFSSRIIDSSHSELYAINSDGTGERRITYPNNKDKDLPSVFRNRVVYRQVEDKKSQRASLLIIGINGGQPKPIIESKIVCYPRWSHDGKLIAYENYPGNNVQEIWVIDSNGKNNHKLISNARHPCWAYNNETMLFTRDYEVWALDIKKGTEQRLTNLTKDTVALFPAISPDGERFAYQGQFGDHYGIFITDLKNGRIQKVIAGCGDVSFWTDNPKYICTYRPYKGENNQIVLVNVETGEKTFITNNKRANYCPAWVSGK